MKTVIDVALEKSYPELLPIAKETIKQSSNQETLGEDRENLIHTVNEALPEMER